MGLKFNLKFQWKRPGRKVTRRRRSTLAEMTERSGLRLQKSIADGVVRLAERDPEFDRALAAKQAGIEIAPTDPAVEERRKLDELLSQKFEEKLQNDPVFASDVIEERIKTMVTQYSRGSRREDGGTGDHQRTVVSGLLRRLEEYKAFQTRVRDGNGSVGDIPEDPALRGLIELIGSVVTGKQGLAGSRGTGTGIHPTAADSEMNPAIEPPPDPRSPQPPAG